MGQLVVHRDRKHCVMPMVQSQGITNYVYDIGEFDCGKEYYGNEDDGEYG